MANILSNLLSLFGLGGKAAATGSGLRYTELLVGDGVPVKSGDVVTVHYTGWLDENGKKGKNLILQWIEEKVFNFQSVPAKSSKDGMKGWWG